MTTLPESVLAAVDIKPIEKIALAALRDKYPDLKIGTLIADNQTFPFMLLRRDGDWGDWDGDPRFLDAGQLSVQTFASGIEADTDAGQLGWAALVGLRESVNQVFPGLGHITKARMLGAPHRMSDWASSTGPVQFADLPAGVVRYETTFFVEFKKPTSS